VTLEETKGNFSITYVARSFLDYRIPVIKSLSSMVGNKFYFIYSKDYVPDRVDIKVRKILGHRAIGMTGEKRIGPNEFSDFANTAFRVVYQPGLVKEISKTKPDVLIGDGFFQWTSFALFYKILKKVPLVVCYERTFHTERNAQYYRTAYRRFIIKFIDAMSCNGRLSLDYTKWLGIPAERITTGHMVADTENLQRAISFLQKSEFRSNREKLGSPEIIFVSVGRLIKLKGIKELLLGWSLLEKIHAEIGTLIIIGTGPEMDSLKSLARELKLKQVIFEGHVAYDEIAGYYAAADVLVMPTLEDIWCVVVPEGMACGLPILCSKYNGCYPELIASGENGWVFDPLSIKDTYQALRKCIDNRSRLKQMGQKSKEIISQHTPRHAAQAIFDACKIAIANKSKNKHAHPYRS
jgi:glycosyltransferase involved in cell wall biosynthesis